jgi:hypothetical protein
MIRLKKFRRMQTIGEDFARDVPAPNGNQPDRAPLNSLGNQTPPFFIDGNRIANCTLDTGEDMQTASESSSFSATPKCKTHVLLGKLTKLPDGTMAAKRQAEVNNQVLTF